MIFADTGKFLLVVFLKKLVRPVIFPDLCTHIKTTPKMKIEIATIEDVPEILNLQYKAFYPVAEQLNWLDAP
ncbi:MAG: hypothetical protein II165_06060, partial [Bacteroidales bacterium]|nr:hypothetical protein [Bacteroidales bacterium]